MKDLPSCHLLRRESNWSFAIDEIQGCRYHGTTKDIAHGTLEYEVALPFVALKS